jgi:hypothetical protein
MGRRRIRRMGRRKRRRRNEGSRETGGWNVDAAT